MATSAGVTATRDVRRPLMYATSPSRRLMWPCMSNSPATAMTRHASATRRRFSASFGRVKEPSAHSRGIALGRLDARLMSDVRVAAAVPQQRVDLRLVDAVRDHLAGEEKVVSGLAHVAHLAPHDRDAAGDRRSAARIRGRLERLD